MCAENQATDQNKLKKTVGLATSVRLQQTREQRHQVASCVRKAVDFDKGTISH